MSEEDKKPEETGLESKLDTSHSPSTRKIASVDIAGNITYSLLVGTMLDYSAGLSPAGIAVSRASATVINAAIGGPYGWWREQTFKAAKTNEDSTKLRKTLVDLLAFNTFQVPMYAGVLAIGSLISEGEVNWDRITHGCAYLSAASPLIAPTLGMYMDWFRKLCGVNSAARGAYQKKTPTRPSEK